MRKTEMVDEEEEKWLRSQYHHYHTVKKDRSLAEDIRFHGSIAKEHGVRVSALVYHIAAWTRNKAVRYRTAYEWDPQATFGKAVGLKDDQLHRVLVKAKEAGLLDYERTFRAVRIWIADDRLYALPTNDVYKYSKELSKKLGMTESILYLKIVYHTQNPEDEVAGIRTGYGWFTERFPWMTRGAVKRALYRLRDAGLINWHQDRFCYRGSHLYYALNVQGRATSDRKPTSRQFTGPKAAGPKQGQKPRSPGRRKTDNRGTREAGPAPVSYPFGGPDAVDPETRLSRRDFGPVASYE